MRDFKELCFFVLITTGIMAKRAPIGVWLCVCANDSAGQHSLLAFLPFGDIISQTGLCLLRLQDPDLSFVCFFPAGRYLQQEEFTSRLKLNASGYRLVDLET